MRVRALLLAVVVTSSVVLTASPAAAVTAPSCIAAPVQVLSNANLPSGWQHPSDPDIADLGVKYLFFAAGKYSGSTYTGHDILFTSTTGAWTTTSWSTPALLSPGAWVAGKWDGYQMETPHFVQGVDGGQTVYRIYYSARREGSLGNGIPGVWRIGYFQWNGSAWVRRAQIAGQPDAPVLGQDYTTMASFEKSTFYNNLGQPVEVANAYEPTVRYFDDGQPSTPNWHMWYQAGAQWDGNTNPDHYIAYASSTDGRTWTLSARHTMWTSGPPPLDNAYNVDVRQANGRWEMALAQTHNQHPFTGADFPGTGIYWAQSTTPSGTASNWSFQAQTVPILAHVDNTWYEKVLSPTFTYSGNNMHTFFHAYEGIGTPSLVLRIGRVDCTVT